MPDKAKLKQKLDEAKATAAAVDELVEKTDGWDAVPQESIDEFVNRYTIKKEDSVT